MTWFLLGGMGDSDVLGSQNIFLKNHLDRLATL